MKKIDFAISVMTLLLLVVSSGLIESRVRGSILACTDIEGCCGNEVCNGPGTVNGCSITCEGGGVITCNGKKNKDGSCQ
jgi:hypothetical protein